MALASLKELYFDELADLFDAETLMIRTLPRLAEAARAPELRQALKKHYDESRLHLERLELIFTHWGERPRSRPCAGLAGIVQEADNRLNQEATDEVRDAAIIGGAQRMEHYEIAAYGCARTYARQLNRLDEARLLQETLDDEGRTDHCLSALAEAHINDDAQSEADFHAPPPVSRSQRAEHLPKERRSPVNEFVPVPGESAEPVRERMVARELEPSAPSTEEAPPPRRGTATDANAHRRSRDRRSAKGDRRSDRLGASRSQMARSPDRRFSAPKHIGDRRSDP